MSHNKKNAEKAQNAAENAAENINVVVTENAAEAAPKKMNTYAKYCPNVFVAKCDEKHEKGEIITLSTRYGKENECEVWNFLYEKDGFFYYSITRADGFNCQERAQLLIDLCKEGCE